MRVVLPILLAGIALGVALAQQSSNGGARSGRSSTTNEVEKKPAGPTEVPSNKNEKQSKGDSQSREENGKQEPLSTFKPKERIPIDQGVDFPVDI